MPLLPRTIYALPVHALCVSLLFARTLRVRWARGNKLGADGWTAVADALEGVASLTSLNGCDKCRAIRAGGQTELKLAKTELGVWAARYLPRSASTLTKLNLRQTGRTLSLTHSLSLPSTL